MTLSEFKAWFEGFSEGIDKAPTEAQFTKIKAKVADIDGAPVTYPVFIDRYRYWGWPATGPYHSTWTSSGNGVALLASGTSSSFGSSTAGYAYIDPASKGDTQTEPWDSHAAMRELGRAEAQAA